MYEAEGCEFLTLRPYNIPLHLPQLMGRPENRVLRVEVDGHRLPLERLDILQVVLEAIRVLLQHQKYFGPLPLEETQPQRVLFLLPLIALRGVSRHLPQRPPPLAQTPYSPQPSAPLRHLSPLPADENFQNRKAGPLLEPFPVCPPHSEVGRRPGGLVGPPPPSEILGSRTPQVGRGPYAWLACKSAPSQRMVRPAMARPSQIAL